MLKQVRIDAGGVIVGADRRVYTTKDPKHDGPDRVQWVRTPGDNERYVVRFASTRGSPFEAGHSPTNPHDLPVPPGGPGTVTQAAGEYKYSVYRADAQGNPIGNPTDDPDVVIV